ncbi:MAG: tetratricopeptide repeat protein [Candidatus Dormibacteria bacterium]
MIVELFVDGSGFAGRPNVLLTLNTAAVTVREANGMIRVFRERIGTDVESSLDKLTTAAWRKCSKQSTAVKRNRRDARIMGPVRRLVLRDGDRSREITWAPMDTLQPEVRELVDALGRLERDIPVRQWNRSSIAMCRKMAMEQFGGETKDWHVVTKTDEVFDTRLSIPDEVFEGVMTMEGVEGTRIVLKNGDKYAAFHTSGYRREIALAESWGKGELPKYPPALVALARTARRAGQWKRAIMMFNRAMQHDRWGVIDTEATMEIAELYALHGSTEKARAIYERYLYDRSQMMHVLASCGLAWIDALETAAGGNPPVPPPSTWEELRPSWWRSDASRAVSGVPARSEAMQHAVANAAEEWSQHYRTMAMQRQGVA